MNILKYGWMHPLGKIVEIDGQTVRNSWNIASRIVATATRRIEAKPLTLGITTSFLLTNNLVTRDETITSYTKDTEYIQLIDKTQAKIEELGIMQ